MVVEAIEWVTTSTEEEAGRQGAMNAVAREIEGLIVLEVTEIGPGIAEIGDISIPPMCSFETITEEQN